MIETRHPEFYDLARLFRFREVLEGLRQDAPPRVTCLSAPDLSTSKRAGIFSGSFNPPTIAHIELARHAKELFNLDRVFFTLSRVTVNKERVEGLILEDRLLLVSLIAEEQRWAAVVVANRGLYFEQAKAFRSLLGNSARISFVIGMDKLIQIFDARYYQDRDTALRALLTEAQLLVAMRGQLGMEELERLLARSENEPYRDRVFPFTLPVEVKEISSSSLRSGIGHGEHLQGKVPEIVEEFIAETGAYRPIYEFRSKLLDFLYQFRDSNFGLDFLELSKKVREDSKEGSKLRRLLQSPDTSLDQLKEFIALGGRSGYHKATR